MPSIRRALVILQVDAALAPALGHRVWHALSGLATMIVVARFFSPELQGCYYTFGSVLALQALGELGLFIVVQSLASHEWAHLRLGAAGRISGEPDALSRLVSLGRRTAVFCAITSLLSAVVAGSVGVWLFARTAPPGVSWQLEWFALVSAYAVSFALLPLVSLLEGCDQMRTINNYRLVFAVLSSMVTWTAMVGGLALWAPALGIAVLVVRDGVLVGLRYRSFFAPFLLVPQGPTIGWMREVWPMQWRLAVMAMFQLLGHWLFNPIVMYFHGATAAGRMGMTWAIFTGVQMVSLVWLQTRAPALGVLAARGDRSSFERLWRRASVLSLAVAALGGAALAGVVTTLSWLGSPYADRLLPMMPTLWLAAGVVGNQVVQCFATYLRAHKRERLTAVSVTSNVVLGVLALSLGARAGELGISIAYAVAMSAVGIPGATLVWHRFRRSNSHRPAPEPLVQP